MKKRVVVFLVAGLFIGTTLAGASVVETYSNTKETCPGGQVGPPGVCGLKYDGYALQGPNWKHFDKGDTVTYCFSITWSNGVDTPLKAPVSVSLLNNDKVVNSITVDGNPNWPICSSWHTISFKYDKDGKYIVKLKWHDADEKEHNGVGIWSKLTTYIGDVKPKIKDDPSKEPCPAAGNGLPGIYSFFFQDIPTPFILRCTNTELVDGKVGVRFRVDLSYSGDGGPATDIDLDIFENDIKVIDVHFDWHDENINMSETYIFTRTFTNNGTYTIEAKADAYNSEGTYWVTFAFPLKVNVGKEYWQKSKVDDDLLGFRLLFLKFLDRFPILHQILNP